MIQERLLLWKWLWVSQLAILMGVMLPLSSGLTTLCWRGFYPGLGRYGKVAFHARDQVLRRGVRPSCPFWVSDDTMLALNMSSVS